jgi:hypothetical protein
LPSARIGARAALALLIVIAAAAPAARADLVLAYGFDEGIGLTAYDASAAPKAHGLLALPGFAPPKLGTGSLLFEQRKWTSDSGDWVLVNDHDKLDVASALTVEAWVHPTVEPDGSSTWGVVLSKGAQDYFLAASHAGAGTTMVPSAGGTFGGVYDVVQATGAPIPIGAWTHLAMSYDSATGVLKIYVDGLERGSKTVASPGPIRTSRNPLTIGSMNGNVDATGLAWGGKRSQDAYFWGRIDEVRIWSQVRSSVEILADMATPVSADDTVAPEVTLTAPAAEGVSDLVHVTATASDDVGVVKVEFLLDGAPLGADLSPPYRIPWSTLTATSATHVLEARAYDASGHATTSGPVSVTVQNPKSVSGAPRIDSITAKTSTTPLDGATGVPIGSTLRLTWNEALLDTSVTGTTVKLLAQSTLAPVPATIRYTSGGRVVEIDPKADLRPGLPYIVSVAAGKKGVKDLADRIGFAGPTTVAKFTTGFVSIPPGAYAGYGEAELPSSTAATFHGPNAPFLAGIDFSIAWGAVEQADGVFDWSTIDAALQYAMENGKKAWIGHDNHTYRWKRVPEYMLTSAEYTKWYKYDEARCPEVDLQTPPLFQQNPNCVAVGAPVPWEPAFQTRYIRFMNALSDHLYLERPELGATVAVVGSQGGAFSIVIAAGDMPEERPRPDSSPLWESPVDDAANSWCVAPFLATGQKAYDTIVSFIEATMAAFPDKTNIERTEGLVFEPTCSGWQRGRAAIDASAHVLANHLDRFVHLFEVDDGDCQDSGPGTYRPRAAGQFGAGGSSDSVLGTIRTLISNTEPYGCHLAPIGHVGVATSENPDRMGDFAWAADALNLDGWRADSTPPPAVGVVTATKTGSDAVLTWTATKDRWDKPNAYTDGREGAAVPEFPWDLTGSSPSTVGYNVYRCNSLGASCVFVAATEGGADPGLPRYTHKKPPQGTWTWRVEAFDAVPNASPHSAPSNALVFTRP